MKYKDKFMLICEALEIMDVNFTQIRGKFETIDNIITINADHIKINDKPNKTEVILYDVTKAKLLNNLVQLPF